MSSGDSFSVVPALTYIQANLDDDLRLETLARRSSLSPYQFHRVFHEGVAETLKQYTQRLRLERAAIEMLLHDAPLLQIAMAVGFNNHETFSRAFRRWSGVSPSEYRKTWRSSRKPDRPQNGKPVGGDSTQFVADHPNPQKKSMSRRQLKIERRFLLFIVT
jgi:AraC-like DNA-binding protein